MLGTLIQTEQNFFSEVPMTFSNFQKILKTFLVIYVVQEIGLFYLRCWIYEFKYSYSSRYLYTHVYSSFIHESQKWNKLDTKGQILHDLTYVRYL